jgi:hypothetical protein
MYATRIVTDFLDYQYGSSNQTGGAQQGGYGGDDYSSGGNKRTGGGLGADDTVSLTVLSESDGRQVD